MNVHRTFCRAKLNLYLAVTGKRPDGYHNLLSLVSQIGLGDDLEGEISEDGCDTLSCGDPSLSCGPDNLILKAAEAYRTHVPDAPFVSFKLAKRIPCGAGLGGGSSDGAGALRIMNEICGGALNGAQMLEAAAQIGSDCPLFLFDKPVIMRGRGEKIETVSDSVRKVLRALEVVVVKPSFGIPTAWAYGALDKGNAMMTNDVAEEKLRAFHDNPSVNLPLFNSFEKVVFRKYQCYDALNGILAANDLPKLHLTGSGSACFALANDVAADRMMEICRENLGAGTFIARTRLVS
jgi:4-diphosphocytidyl-2-C-methyl-D-erythritol kinase